MLRIKQTQQRPIRKKIRSWIFSVFSLLKMIHNKNEILQWTSLAFLDCLLKTDIPFLCTSFSRIRIRKNYQSSYTNWNRSSVNGLVVGLYCVWFGWVGGGSGGRWVLFVDCGMQEICQCPRRYKQQLNTEPSKGHTATESKRVPP
jgi:hypothetical protein